MTVAAGYLHPGQYSACFAESLIELRDMTPAVTRRISVVCGPNGIIKGRNHVVAEFLKTDCEHLWFIDTDMGFAPDTVTRLLAVCDPDRPIVGALAFAQKIVSQTEHWAIRYRVEPQIYDWHNGLFHPRLDYQRNTIVDCDAVGTPCVVIHRTVLEQIPSPFNAVTVDGVTFGEDMSFCLTAARHGFPIAVHTGVKTAHHKGGVFLDEHHYDQTRRR